MSDDISGDTTATSSTEPATSSAEPAASGTEPAAGSTAPVTSSESVVAAPDPTTVMPAAPGSIAPPPATPWPSAPAVAAPGSIAPPAAPAPSPVAEPPAPLWTPAAAAAPWATTPSVPVAATTSFGAAAPPPPSGLRPAAATAPPSGPPPAPRPAPTSPATTAAPAWVRPFAVLAALALFVGGALTGWAIADRDDGGSGRTNAADAGGIDQISAPIDPPVAGDADEPVAAVAAAVAPSVVQIETNNGLGSGIVMDEDGHILTAAHVLDGADQVRVRLADGTLVAGEIVGTNPATDVGVVAIDAPDELEPAVLGIDAEVVVGQLAVAVGSPFGLEQTVTSGVVSALDRPVETDGTSLVGMIQTDASINPGNSGGALADRYGRIIGINDAIRTSGGGNEGVGFAIPIGLAVRVAEQVIAGEEIQAGLLGVTVTDPTDGAPGALVGEIMPGTPAASSGLEVGDLITAVDGDAIQSTQALRAEILSRAPGTEVTVEVVRDGDRIEFDVTLASATD